MQRVTGTLSREVTNDVITRAVLGHLARRYMRCSAADIDAHFRASLSRVIRKYT